MHGFIVVENKKLSHLNLNLSFPHDITYSIFLLNVYCKHYCSMNNRANSIFVLEKSKSKAKTFYSFLKRYNKRITIKR